MKKIVIDYEVITRCFAGGAMPDTTAEIRSATIRGQLRWWFRALGGFANLSELGMTVRKQEDRLFGSISSDPPRAGSVAVRVERIEGQKLQSTTAKTADDLGYDLSSGGGYLLFPMRQNRKALFDSAKLPAFRVSLIVRERQLSVERELGHLLQVFGELGSIGFRGRRAMGALFVRSTSLSLVDSLQSFADPSRVLIRTLGQVRDEEDAIRRLGGWLRDWRSHGRSPKTNAFKKGYFYAKKDHDAGLGHHRDDVFRPAIGLPIIQKFSGSVKRTWRGRFASPVILRPYRDGGGVWHALIIFADCYKWDISQKVLIDSEPRRVSLELYEEMKSDERLRAFV